MILMEQTPYGSGVLFKQKFRNLREVQDARGVVVASTVGAAGPGISPLGVSARVTYGGTHALLVNATQMTIRLRFRTASVQNVTTRRLLCKTPLANNDNQFFVQLQANHLPIVFIASSAADLANAFFLTAGSLPTSTIVTLHAVYNGGLAAGSRGLLYQNGLAVGTTIAGTIPVAMRASASPITLFQFDGGAVSAPDNDFVLYDCDLRDRALSAAEVYDDAFDLTYQEITP